MRWVNNNEDEWGDLETRVPVEANHASKSENSMEAFSDTIEQ